MQGRKLLEAHMDPTSFGNLAVRTKAITSGDMRKAVLYQQTKAKDLKLGEVCVYLGLINREELNMILGKQTVLRKPDLEKRAIVLAQTANATAKTQHLTEVLDTFRRRTLKLAEKFG